MFITVQLGYRERKIGFRICLHFSVYESVREQIIFKLCLLAHKVFSARHPVVSLNYLLVFLLNELSSWPSTNIGHSMGIEASQELDQSYGVYCHCMPEKKVTQTNSNRYKEHSCLIIMNISHRNWRNVNIWYIILYLFLCCTAEQVTHQCKHV